jgi:hypothetical protein
MCNQAYIRKVKASFRKDFKKVNSEHSISMYLWRKKIDLGGGRTGGHTFINVTYFKKRLETNMIKYQEFYHLNKCIEIFSIFSL